LGANNHTDKEREENDFYATSPEAAEWLLKLEKLNENIWECSAGSGHLSEVFIKAGHKVMSSDLIDRGYGKIGIDFLKCNKIWKGDIITNPPYRYALEFVEKGLELVNDGNKVIMFLKLQFLEGKNRRKFFDKYPPKTIWVSSSRITCAKNADFKTMKDGGGSAVAYAWYVWEKGFTGITEIKWFN
jgi:hypothetical protein